MKKKKILSVLNIIFILGVFLNGCTVNYEKKLYDYTKKSSVFSFEEIFSFEWDVAYNDIEIYGYATKVKNDIEEDFSIDNIPADHLHRFLFFKDGNLVKEIFYEFMVFHFPDNVFKFYPDTEFCAEWYDIVNNGQVYQNAKIYLKE